MTKADKDISLDNEHLSEKQFYSLVSELLSEKSQTSTQFEWQHILICNHCLNELQDIVTDQIAMDLALANSQRQRSKAIFAKTKETIAASGQAFKMVLESVRNGMAVLEDNLSFIHLEPLPLYRQQTQQNLTDNQPHTMQKTICRRVQWLFLYQGHPIIFAISKQGNRAWQFQLQSLPPQVRLIEIALADEKEANRIIASQLVSTPDERMVLENSLLFSLSDDKNKENKSKEDQENAVRLKILLDNDHLGEVSIKRGN